MKALTEIIKETETKNQKAQRRIDELERKLEVANKKYTEEIEEALECSKVVNGKLMLHIRDNARDQNNPAEIWIDKNSSPANQMDLASDMCMYFKLF